MPSAQDIVARLLTFDDDVATDAVEALIELGPAALPALHELLTLDAMIRHENCDNGERLYYVARALRAIGDPTAWEPALRYYLDLDEHTTGGANFKYYFKTLIDIAKASAPERCGALPDVGQIDDYASARASLRERVHATLTAPA